MSIESIDSAADLAAAVQAYVRAKWRSPYDMHDVAHFGRRLPASVRNRIDALGADDEWMCFASVDEVERFLRSQGIGEEG